jgi:hypothetical protein
MRAKHGLRIFIRTGSKYKATVSLPRYDLLSLLFVAGVRALEFVVALKETADRPILDSAKFVVRLPFD